MQRNAKRLSLGIGLLLTTVLLATPALAQLGERPGGIRDTSLGPVDVSGMSIKSPRVRVIHTENTSDEGGSMWLQTFDPFLAWKKGKDLSQRQMRPRDGVFAILEEAVVDSAISNFSGSKLDDGVSPAIIANDQVSCAGCHNIPYRDAGGGTNFTKRAGLGRNAPHFFGVGILDILGMQIRMKLMQQMDTNRDNWISKAEMTGQEVFVEPTPGATPISFGVNADADADGLPDLNRILHVFMVDADGNAISADADKKTLTDEGVAGFNFYHETYGWAESDFNLHATSRIFFWAPWSSHSGMQTFDPTTRPVSVNTTLNNGFGRVSNAGILQPWVGQVPPDRGNNVNALGLSLDDPDGDGVITEGSEGDMDMTEWYTVNSPRPGRDRQTEQTSMGGQKFSEWGCDSCHVANWFIEPADPDNPDIHKRYPGDVRFFDLDVAYNEDAGRLTGQLTKLYDIDPETGAYVRRLGSYQVEGLGSDLRFHMMGRNLVDIQYDGSTVNRWRTGLLWGNGASGFPWGHDGKSTTLDDIIRRHGGEAGRSRIRYENAEVKYQEAVIAWLNTFVLYSTDQVPTDIDGDGEISGNFMVAGENTGYERFNPEWLFRNPGKIEGTVKVKSTGKRIRSDALVNVAEAYGLDLEYLHDGDLDGFADKQDACPDIHGYKDGCE